MIFKTALALADDLLKKGASALSKGASKIATTGKNLASTANVGGDFSQGLSSKVTNANVPKQNMDSQKDAQKAIDEIDKKADQIGQGMTKGLIESGLGKLGM